MVKLSSDSGLTLPSSALRPEPMDPAGLVTRRGALQAALGCMAGASSLQAFCATPLPGDGILNAPRDFWSVPRWVWIRRASTGEELKLTYWSDGHIHIPAHRQISWFLRDRRFEALLASDSTVLSQAIKRGRLSAAQMTPWALIDPIVLDILYAYSAWLHVYGIHRAIECTSGFRHFLSNELTEGAAKDSWHTKAGAVDFFIPGVSTEQVARFGMWLAGGGVGLYRSKNFTHADRGRVRSWVK